MENPGETSVDRRLYEIGRSWADGWYTPETHLLGVEVRGAAAYALFLAAEGTPDACREAEAVVRAVVAQQEHDPDSPHFGWFRTSSEAEGYRDPNWSAFCGTYLLHIPRAYGDRIGADCRKTIEEAVLRACASVKKRDVVPGYTNIALLSAALLSVAGELYGAPEYLEEGRRKLRELADFINLTGGFQEYNSPTYAGVSMSALCWMGTFVQTEEIHDLALRIQGRMWHTLSAHYHAPTGQLAGPYSRAYGNRLQRYAGAVKYYLYKVLGDAFDLGENKTHGHDTAYGGVAALQEVACPEEALERLRDVDFPRTVKEAVRTDGRPLGPGYVGPFEQMTTHLADRYALGTINAKESWVQRRNLVVHWVGPNRSPAALTEGVWENGEPSQRGDLRFWSAQKAGRALAFYDLSTMEERTLSSVAVAVRLEVDEPPELWVSQKAVEALPRTFSSGSTVLIRSGEVGIALRFHAEGMGGARAQGEIREAEGGLVLVLDLYRGEPQAVSGKTLEGAFCVCQLEVQPVESDREAEAFLEAFESGDVQIESVDGRLQARWRSEDAVLAIAPTGEEGARRYEGIVDGIPVHPERLVEEPL